MNDLIKWNLQIPADTIVDQAIEILTDADWKTAFSIGVSAKVGQRAAEVLNMKAHIKAMKRAALWAERRLGELLKDMDKSRGQLKKGPRLPTVPTGNPPSYADLGITKRQALQWQKFVAVDKKTFKQVVDETPTAAAILKAAAPETTPPTTTAAPPSDFNEDSESDSIQFSVSSLKSLIQLVQELVISEKTVLLYLYYCIYGHTSPTQQEIKNHTRLSFKTIQTHNKVLEILGGIKRIPPEKGQGRHTKVQVLDITPPTSSSLPLLIDTLDIRTQKTQAQHMLSGTGTLSGTRKKTRGGVVSNFTVADIESDEDWQKTKVPLEKYFKKFELDPVALTRKKRFSKLIELVLDETFEFDAYCEWYSETKYSDKGFNFGFFLHHGVIEEFRFAYKQDGRYLRTSSDIGNSESYKQGVERTKEFIDKLEDE